jgi:hypothetical protein
MAKLHRFLEVKFHDRRREFVALRTWNSDAEATAAQIAARKPRKVIVVGYSYGCGWGLPQLAQALGAWGVGVDLALLVDPVPRWTWLPLKWLALTRWGVYRVPVNVGRVHYWRQVNGAPFGRRVVAGRGSGMVFGRGSSAPGKPGRPGVRSGVRCEGVYGAMGNLFAYANVDAEEGRWVATAGDDHLSIDDKPAIHRRILDLIEAEVSR